jgi:hypothetical protein
MFLVAKMHLLGLSLTFISLTQINMNSICFKCYCQDMLWMFKPSMITF